MKKLLALLLLAASLMTFTSCSEDPVESTGESNGDNNNGSQTTAVSGDIDKTTSEDHVTTVKVTPDSWGVSQICSGMTGTNIGVFYINLPKYKGYTAGANIVSGQDDGTMSIVGGQLDTSPEVSDITKLFPTYFNQIQDTVQAIYGGLSKNYILSLTGDKAVKINDYDMHSFTGVIEFDKDKDHFKFNFVAYATKIKSNGAYAYWLVYDESPEQKNGALIAEYALNMAKTFREKD